MLTEHLTTTTTTKSVSPKNRTIALTSKQEGPCTTVRLERLVPGRVLDSKEVQHMSTSGAFENVVVLRKACLESVCKPHVMTSFNAYVIDTSETGKFLERPQKKERRELKFWFYRGVSDEEKLVTCAQFVKHLLHAETFPADGLSYIKKNLLLMKDFDSFKRIELQNTQEPDEEEQEEQVPLIENFITVLTPAMYDYQYLPEVPVSKKSKVSFRLRAAADGHVALSYVYGDTDRRTYEVVLGGWGNRRSAIRYGGRGEVQVEKLTPGILDKNEFRDFWISWTPTSLRVGRGLDEGQDCFMEWLNIPAKKHHTINLISVSTGPGSDGRWEFVEYIVPYEMARESKSEKRYKVLRGLVWYSKKNKIISRLEEAFPCALNMPDLLRLSTVSLSNMLEALVFLKRTQRDGNVLETSKGVWMRSHAHPADKNHELKKVLQIPRLSSLEAPTVAIVTSTYLEKVAVDVMFDRKTSYLIEGGHRRDKYSNQFYTVGSMAGKNVVSMKLSHFNPEISCSEKHAQCVADLLNRFESVQSVLVVGVGGAVPDYNNFDNHCRRGDVVISSPRSSDGAMYVCCSEVDDEQEADPTGNSAFFPTSSWNSDDAGGNMRQRIRYLVDSSSSRSSEPNQLWERYLNEGIELLAKADERFHRPPAKTDKLMARINRLQEPIEVTHPSPQIGKHGTRRENHPVLKKGAIASGKTVARDLIYRRIFSSRNQIQAFDCGLEKVVEAIINNRGVDNTALVLGMSDYSDGTVAKSWQPYASLASAACAKALISLL